jgi:hypothetical protein
MFDEETEDAALAIQKIVRGRQGRRSEDLMRKRRAIQKRHEATSDIEVIGISRGRKGRNHINGARSEELAVIRIQSQVRGRSGRSFVSKKIGTLPLSISMVRKGLKCHGRHPFLLRHTFLQLELSDLEVRGIDILAQFSNVLYLNLSNNIIKDLSVLSNFPCLLELKAR